MKQPNTKVMEARAEIEQTRHALNSGIITYEEAKRAAQEPIATLNERAREIAKEHGVRFQPLTFVGLMR